MFVRMLQGKENTNVETDVLVERDSNRAAHGVAEYVQLSWVGPSYAYLPVNGLIVSTGLDFPVLKIHGSKPVELSGPDVVSIPKTNENFRILYDTKGRFRLHSIRDGEAKFKLCKVRSIQFGQKGIPYLNTYDGRTIRYPDPLIKANDTIKLDLESNKITDFIKFDVGNVVMVTGIKNGMQGFLSSCI
ncbi:hypothetical protein L1049_014389 [Liquidambar formosana]|uniref:Small ribosomal subunit protein eS4 central region domain-containing protein n=1 Tax=Liquidambar formosana TaxID=63359 RepID=A0AAP0WXM7_LIQFO